MKYRLIVLSVIAFLLSSCGQYGSLYLPGEPSKKQKGNTTTMADRRAASAEDYDNL